MAKVTKRPVVIIVRDGWGENPFSQWDHANAVLQANRPVDIALRKKYPFTLIRTSGEDVGLPLGIMGNSEVGHQNIGAGRIVDQELLRISKLFRTREMSSNPVLQTALKKAAVSGKLHIMGLASDAGVHSALEHLFGLLAMAKELGVPSERVFVHHFTDGRDSAPDAGIQFNRSIEAKMKEIGVGRVASIIGRFYAMDRDDRWDRVEKAYRMLAFGDGRKVNSAEEAFTYYYANPTEANRTGDEFIEASVVVDANQKPIGLIESGDVVVFYNFRGDRPRELTKAFVMPEFPFVAIGRDGTSGKQGFERGINRMTAPKLDLHYVTLTEYEKGLPVEVALKKPPKMKSILGEYVSGLGLQQFRCAETEKFPHVTFFFNDYREEPFPGEDRQIVPSPRDVSTYDLKPEMSAFEVTNEMLSRVASDRYDLMILNYANGDMVGHTGSLPAAIKAVEAVDQCVGRVVDAVLAKGGALIVTADHGNCEQMIDPLSGRPHTAHTTYEVPLYVVDPARVGSQLRTGGRLADIAPTALDLLGLAKPDEMLGETLCR